MATATYHTKDQNWTNGSTTYWFEVTGLSFDGWEYDGLYGVVEGRNAGIVHDNGEPVWVDWIKDAVRESAIVTAEMRAE